MTMIPGKSRVLLMRPGLLTLGMLLLIPNSPAMDRVLMCRSAEVVSGPENGFRFPTVRPDHPHARKLLANAMLYLDPKNGMTDPNSGYPFEGWNQDPSKGLFLRSFTQLTAIGLYMELMANIAIGRADTPFITREQAFANLNRVVASLRHDQQDPRLSKMNLLGNFLDLATGRRLGPLAAEVEKRKILEVFGRTKGEAVWKALEAKGWVTIQNEGREGAIVRSTSYGFEHFDGALAPFKDDVTRSRVMELLDQRVVLLVFVDNANLSSSAAKTIGALLGPELSNSSEAIGIRKSLEDFLDAQKAGYTRLYDAKAGQFYFGWDATRDRYFGWVDLQGRWVTGHVDYLVNEFRGPATFIVTRFGLPIDAIGNLGFKMRPYRLSNGREHHVLAPWEGSAFQALGLELSMTELDRPSWRSLLNKVVDVEIDYATRQDLPGFLSESYSGEGAVYTGSIGIPDITVSPLPRITDAASLYTLGTAYVVAPEKVEAFLAANWPVISSLFTDHGPWEGYKKSRREPIRFQTSAHTFSLILGLLGTASEHMARYLESRQSKGTLDALFRTGPEADLMGGTFQVFAWDDKDHPLRSTRNGAVFRAYSERVNNPGIAFVANDQRGVNLSGAMLKLCVRSEVPMKGAVLTLKSAPNGPGGKGHIATEILFHPSEAVHQDREISMTLPATPGLTTIKEVVLTLTPENRGKSLDLTISAMNSRPAEHK